MLTHNIPSSSSWNARRLLCDWNKWLATVCWSPQTQESAKLFECCKKSAEASPLMNLFYARGRVIYYREWVCCNNFLGSRKKARDDSLNREIPCQIEMPLREVAQPALEIVSRFNLISEKKTREENAQLWNNVHFLLFTILLSQQSQHTSVWYTRDSPNTADLPKNGQCRESEEKKSDFEENNYIVPRQMPKCSLFDAFDEWFMILLGIFVGSVGCWWNFYFTFSRRMKRKVISALTKFDRNFGCSWNWVRILAKNMLCFRWFFLGFHCF